MNWFLKRKMRGVLAASLYEPPEADEKARLDRALAGDAAFRAEADELRLVRGAVRLEAPEFTGDLSGIVRRRLEEQRAVPVRNPWLRHPAASVAFASLVVAVVALTPLLRDGSGKDGAARQPESVITAAAPAAIPLSEACNLIEAHDPAGARRLLDGALAAHPDDPMAGDAQALLADIEFSQFQRYPEAFAAYDHLRTAYPRAFMSSPASVERYNLLSEVKDHNYEPLYALDVARNNRVDGFRQYERVLSQYPATMVAALAMDGMRASLDEGMAQKSPETMARSLETVRGRCTDPAAIAQINLALGTVYNDGLHNAELARTCFTQALASPHQTVSARAREALARLSVPSP